MPLTKSRPAALVCQGRRPSPHMGKLAILSLWAALTVLFAGSCSRAESVLCPSGSEPDAGTQVNLGAVEDCEILLSIRDNAGRERLVELERARSLLMNGRGSEVDASAFPDSCHRVVSH